MARTTAAGRIRIQLDLTPQAPEPPRSAGERCAAIFASATTLGYFTSVSLHLGLAVVLALVWHQVHSDGTAGDGRICTVAFSDSSADGPLGLDDFDVIVEPTGGATGEEWQPALLEDANGSLSGEPQIAPPVTREGTGDGGVAGDGSGAGRAPAVHAGYLPPASGKSVTQGSFTVWTVPEDPGPKEKYLIVIQVAYARPEQRLRFGDVTGYVKGTDGYRMVISGYSARYLTAANQVVVSIPGGTAAVRDTIQVQSALLKESQTLLIEF